MDLNKTIDPADEHGNIIIDEVTPFKPLRTPEFYAWRQRQRIQTPAPRQLFVSKGHEVSEDGNIRKFTRSAKSTQPDVFDTKVCKLSKRQAKKLRKATQREMRKIEADDLRFNE
jgi:hypothetical protein